VSLGSPPSSASFCIRSNGLVAGALTGVAVGFLGLPMIASLVGAGGYFILEAIASQFTHGADSAPARSSNGKPTQDRTFPGEHSA
jgi:hypothetical protein